MSSLLDDLQSWVERRAPDAAAEDIHLSLTRGPAHRDKQSAWVDFDSPARSVRLVVWDSGEAVLTVGDVAAGVILADEQRAVTSRFGLEKALEEALAWAESAPSEQ
jgi:hypothetical protein